MALQHRFQAGLDHREWWFAARVDGKDRERTEIGANHPWLARRLGVFGILQGGVARVLRWVGHALIASPVLALLYWTLQSVNPLLAGWVAVIFVCTVVVFFAALNVFIVLAMIRYVLDHQLTLALWSPDQESRLAAEKLLFPDGSAETSRTGQVISIGAPADGDIVLRELVSRSRNVRILEACDFAIRTDEEELVVVRLEDAPLLLAEREESTGLLLPAGTRSALAARGITHPEEERGLQTLVVRVGDRVTVAGVEDTPIPRTDRFELGGEPRGVKNSDLPSAPYRSARGDTALLLHAHSGVPMLITREARP